MRSCVLRAALCGLVLLLKLPAVFAQSAAWTVDAVRLDGQPVAELPDVQRRDKGGEPFRRVSLLRGGTLPEGAEITVPARGGVDLASPNGNRLVLYAGSRMVLLHASGKGERYQQGEGRVRFIVNKALDFFNVHTAEKFLASVKGTQYEIELAPGKAIAFKVEHGAVEVERTGRVRIEQSPGSGATEANNIVEVERLSAGQAKRYDLSTAQYLQQFKTFKDAEAYYRQVAADAEKSGDAERIRRARRNLGWMLVELSRDQEAIRIFEVLFKDAEQRGNDHARAQALLGSGAARGKLNEYAGAIRDGEMALGILRKLYGERDDDEIAALYNNLGFVYGDLNERRKAIEHYERSLAMNKRLFGDRDHNDIAASYLNIGVAYGRLNEFGKATAYFEQALAMRRRLFGDRDHNGIAGLYNNLGVVYRELNEHRKAIEHFEQALAMIRRLFGDGDHDRFATLYENLGLVYGRLNEHRKAIEYNEQALAMRKRLFGDRDHNGIASLYENLGIVYSKLNEHRRAVEYFEQALAVRKRLFGDRAHPEIAVLYGNLGLAHEMGLRDYRRASDFYRLALDMFVKLSGGTDDPRVVRVRRDLADALQKGGDAPAAERLRAEANAMEERLKKPRPQ